MAHLVIPTTPAEIIKLLAAIIARNNELGDDSPIKNLLIDRLINLLADKTNATNAATNDVAADTLRKQSENYTQLSHLKQAPVMTHVAAIGQMLKSYFKPEYTEVGLWGFDIIASGKITLPNSLDEKKELVAKIKEKNDAYDTGASPIAQYLIKHNIDFDDYLEDIEAAVTLQTNSKNASDASENETATRNQTMTPVLDHINIIGSFLMDFYKENQKELGLWGFTVDESTKKPKEQTTKIKLLDKKTLRSVVIGGYVKNAGTTDVHIYKGKTTAGNPIILHPGQTWGVPKKHSIITISNPSDLQTAIVKVLVSGS